MKSITTPPLMILILNVSLSYSSMQTKTSTTHPGLQHTTIYDTTPTQSPPRTTDPRDHILSNPNYPVQETTIITERGSTASQQTTLTTEPLQYTLSSLRIPPTTATTSATTTTTERESSASQQQTTSVVTNQPQIIMTIIITEPSRYALSSLKPPAKRTLTTIKTAETTIHSGRQDFGQLTSADKLKEEAFLPNESLPEVSPEEGGTAIPDSTNSSHEDQTLALKNNQAYLKDVQNGNKIAFDNVTNIASKVANISILERFDKNISPAINETLTELQCLKSGQVKIRNKTKLDSGIGIQVMCSDLILKNDTRNSNRSNFTETNEAVTGRNYSALCLVFVGFVVMLLNGLVLTVCKDSNLRKNVYLTLIFGLAFNDFVLGCVTCIGGLRLLFRWINGLVCIVVTVLAPSCLLISLYQSLLISLHRFLVLSKNECGEIFFKNKRKYFVCFTGWVLLIASVSAFVSPVGANKGLCYHGIVFGGRLFEIRLFFTAIIISFIIATLVFYCLAMQSLRARYLERSSTCLKSSNTDNSKPNRSTNKKIIDSMKLVTILLVALFLFSGPFAYLNMVNLDHEKYKTLFFLAFAFAVLNSVINPIVYYFKISEFKKTLKRMFCNYKQDDETIETNATQNKGTCIHVSQNRKNEQETI